MNFKAIVFALVTLTESTLCMERPPQPMQAVAMNSLQGLPQELKGYLLPFIASDDAENNLVTAATISKSFYKAANDVGHVLAIVDSVLAQKQYALQAINLVKRLQKRRTVTLPVMHSEKVQRWLAATQARLHDGEKLFDAIALTGNQITIEGCFANKYSNLNWQNALGACPLSAAIQGNTALAKCLLSAGADPNIVTKDWTMLSLAADWGKYESACNLLAAGADPNALDSDGRTALVTAVRDYRISMIQLFIEAGADPDLKGAGPNAISAREAAMDEEDSMFQRFKAVGIINEALERRKEKQKLLQEKKMQEALQSPKK